jgi:dolichyl-phosphate beta-glucosyltransferase
LNYLDERSKRDEKFTYEVIVVDDGSKDKTADVALEYGKKYPLSVLKLARNIGKGGTVRCGVLCARGKLILFADADGATKFSDFEKLENELPKKEEAISIGSR